MSKFVVKFILFKLKLLSRVIHQFVKKVQTIKFHQRFRNCQTKRYVPIMCLNKEFLFKTYVLKTSNLSLFWSANRNRLKMRARGISLCIIFKFKSNFKHFRFVNLNLFYSSYLTLLYYFDKYDVYSTLYDVVNK